jgi:hypothetical protein
MIVECMRYLLYLLFGQSRDILQRLRLRLLPKIRAKRLDRQRPLSMYFPLHLGRLVMLL